MPRKKKNKTKKKGIHAVGSHSDLRLTILDAVIHRPLRIRVCLLCKCTEGAIFACGILPEDILSTAFMM